MSTMTMNSADWPGDPPPFTDHVGHRSVAEHSSMSGYPWDAEARTDLANPEWMGPCGVHDSHGASINDQEHEDLIPISRIM